MLTCEDAGHQDLLVPSVMYMGKGDELKFSFRILGFGYTLTEFDIYPQGAFGRDGSAHRMLVLKEAANMLSSCANCWFMYPSNPT